jgi:hypothetical protein
LPVTSTLQLGRTFQIVNLSTGSLTVQSSGLNTINSTVAGGNTFIYTCILTSGTTAASWAGRFDGARQRSGGGDALVLNLTPTIDAPTFTGISLFPAGATSGPPLRLPHGVAPTTPTDGDVWTTTAGYFARINGVTVGPFSAGGGSPITVQDEGSNITTALTTMNFVGAGVTVTGGATATVTIPGGSGGFDYGINAAMAGMTLS